MLQFLGNPGGCALLLLYPLLQAILLLAKLRKFLLELGPVLEKFDEFLVLIALLVRRGTPKIAVRLVTSGLLT